ncbi:MAG: sulfotransferase family protein, partial [Pseudomonadota bacterium]
EPGGDPSAHSWWDGGSFHHNLAKSTGLTTQPRRYVEVADAPVRVQRVHCRMKPHYDHLFAHRIRLG